MPSRHASPSGMCAVTASTSLKREEKDGTIGSDEHHASSDQVQKMTDAAIAEIDQMLAHKEAEISQV